MFFLFFFQHKSQSVLEANWISGNPPPPPPPKKKKQKKKKTNTLSGLILILDHRDGIWSRLGGNEYGTSDHFFLKNKNNNKETYFKMSSAAIWDQQINLYHSVGKFSKPQIGDISLYVHENRIWHFCF